MPCRCPCGCFFLQGHQLIIYRASTDVDVSPRNVDCFSCKNWSGIYRASGFGLQMPFSDWFPVKILHCLKNYNFTLKVPSELPMPPPPACKIWPVTMGAPARCTQCRADFDQNTHRLGTEPPFGANVTGALSKYALNLWYRNRINNNKIVKNPWL